jgi:hypothetical protein
MRGSGDPYMVGLIIDVALFSGMVTFVTGVVIAAANFFI